MGFLLVFLVVLDLVVIYLISSDEKYFFEEEKLKLIFMVLFLPIVGAIWALIKFKDELGWYIMIIVFFLSIALWCDSSSCTRIAFKFLDILKNLMKLL